MDYNPNYPGLSGLLSDNYLSSLKYIGDVKNNIRYALKKKLWDYLGIFPKWRTPMPLLGTPYSKKKLSFIFHFRPLGTFLVFTKKLKFCHYFYIYFWE